ncbi:sensor domain-containing diguanylate cyclase [Shewanella sp. GXUN23E]|uniref:sensor domain-containing diguanylate cyclase n=1 Tax=Shewanella sp. GXUN23E TaxID=3422498 RepID=UPI003D7DEBE9
MNKHNLHPVKTRYNDLRHHLFYLVTPLAIFVSLFLSVLGPQNTPWGLLSCAVLAYILCWVMDYVVCQRKLKDICQHLEKVVQVNQTTYDLMGMSSHYENEQDFLDALLRRSVDLVPGAEMGCILLLNKDNRLTYQTAIGMNLRALQTVELPLANSFAHYFTRGQCDRAVIINDLTTLNAGRGMNSTILKTIHSATDKPILSTLSSPIYIDGKLYGMLNLDSSRRNAFGSYDLSLATILTHEACHAITLFHKSIQIRNLASRDCLTGLYNRSHFEKLVHTWQQQSSEDWQLVVIDMDNLKPLNDHYGHQAGDAALIKLANALRDEWGSSTPIARFGGDEFVALRRGNAASVQRELENIRQSLTLQAGYTVQFSAGLAPFINNWNKAFKQADKAMYAQKRLLKASLSASQVALG